MKYVNFLRKKVGPVASTVITVNRSIPANYPLWVIKKLYPKLEATGPKQYVLGETRQWLHDDQKAAGVRGNTIHQYLKQNDMIKDCASLRDLEEIQKKGIDVFRQHFKGKTLPGWKSVVRDRLRYLLVPCLFEQDDSVVLDWRWLFGGWGSSSPALLFK